MGDSNTPGRGLPLLLGVAGLVVDPPDMRVKKTAAARGVDVGLGVGDAVVDAVVKHFEAAKADGEKFAGQSIRDLNTVNGVRVTVEDGTWGLVRASSNKPELVVVVESPVSEERMREMFQAIDAVLRTHPEVGEYNQTI